MTPTVRIVYVDGSVARCSAAEWSAQRSDGVDAFMVANGAGSSKFHGHSAYWLYREGDVWVAGQAAFGYTTVIPPEVLFHPDDRQSTRPVDFVPDLRHDSIKLGWWLPGTEGRPL